MEDGFLVDGCAAKVKSFNIGNFLQADAVAQGFSSDVYVGNATLSMFVKCEAFLEAEGMFFSLPYCNMVSWTTMLSAYVEQGQGLTALLLYRQMQEEAAGCSDELTFLIGLQACICLADQEDVPFAETQSNKRTSLEIGWVLHIDACRKGLLSSILVSTALLSMYSKCAWSSILTCYVEHDEAEKALLSCRQMQREGRIADQITFVAALQAYAILAEKEEACIVNGFSAKVSGLEIGRALHADADKQGVVSNLFVSSTLISIYGKCGAVGEAEWVFEGLSQRSNVSWNAMLSTYVGQGFEERAIVLYKQLQTQHVTLDEVALIITLQGIGTSGSLDMCKWLHFDIVCAGYDQIWCIISALLHAYGSCASMADAQHIFEKLQKPDIVLWNACIAGHVGEGNAAASLSLLMELNCVYPKPSKVSFLMILSVCGHAGLVVNGLEYFISIRKDYGFNPDIKHYGSLLDLLGRAGDFKRVEDLLGMMPAQANLTIWSCLLGACHTHVNLELALRVYHDAVHFDPEESMPYVLMSNIYANAKLQERRMGEEHFI